MTNLGEVESLVQLEQKKLTAGLERGANAKFELGKRIP